MSGRTWLVLTIAAFLIVIAQPILGWSAIPAFFGHSPWAAGIMGVLDAILMFAPSVAFCIANSR